MLKKLPTAKDVGYEIHYEFGIKSYETDILGCSTGCGKCENDGGTPGTTGGFFEGANGRYGVTNYHVARNKPHPNTYAAWPAQCRANRPNPRYDFFECVGLDENHECAWDPVGEGTVQTVATSVKYDMAVILLDANDVANSRCECFTGDIQNHVKVTVPYQDPIKAPVQGMHVWKHGRTTGLTNGVIAGIYNADLGLNPGRLYKNANAPRYVRNPKAQQFSAKGDSGSWWMDTSDHPVVLHCCGLDVTFIWYESPLDWLLRDPQKDAMGFPMPKILSLAKARLNDPTLHLCH